MAQVNHPSNLLDRIVKLERELAEVRKKVGLSSATISSGGLTVDGGFIKLIDPDGDEIVWMGPLDPPRPDGRLQQAFVVRDDTGAARIFVWDNDPDGEGGYQQQVAINDPQGNRVFQDDKVTGHGLARPWLPLPITRPRRLDWLKCAINSWETLFEIRMHRQQPKIWLSMMSGASDGSTTGQVRIMMNGVQVFWRVYNNATVFVDNEGFDVTTDHFDEIELNIDAIRDSGAGSIDVQIRYCYGWGTVS